MTYDFMLQMEPDPQDYEDLEALIERDRERRDDILRDERVGEKWVGSTIL